MPDAKSYTFGDCVVDTSAREIRRNGQVQSTAPRVFDLIVFLIEQRRRVVPKDELLDRVWSGAFLSESVIARAVMKARNCIGDNAAEPKLIKTIHRVGYRFMAPIEVSGATDTADAFPIQQETPVAGPVVAPMHRIALLPFDNQTGDAQFGWVELGLLSMVNQALESDPRLSASSVTTVLHALGLPGKGPTFEDIASKFRDLLGVGWVGQATVSQTPTSFALSYVLLGPEGLRREAVLHNRELTALGQQLARAIDAAIFIDSPLGISLECADPLTNQLFARYALAREKGQFAQALNLIRVVNDMLPNQTSVRLAHLRALGALQHNEVFALGQTMLCDAEAMGDQRLAAFIHHVLAQAIAETQGDTPAGRYHDSEVLRIANENHGADWTVHLYIGCAHISQLRSETEKTRFLLSRAAEVSRICGNLIQSMLIAQNRAVVEAVEGNLQTAHGIWEQLVQNDSFHQPRSRIAVRINLAEVCAAMGRLDESFSYAEDAAKLLLDLSAADWTWTQIGEVCCRLAEARHTTLLLQVLEAVDACPQATVMDPAHALIARAQLPLSLGEFDSAQPMLLRAVETAVECREWHYAQQWISLLLQNDMFAGRFDVAAARANRFLALQKYEADPLLFGMRQHAHALEAHRAGDHEGARELIASAMNVMKPSPWSVRVRLDAAWLDIERGDLESARRALEGTFRWTEEHPIGLFVQARLLYACGRPADAVMMQQQAIESGTTPTPEQCRFLNAFRDAARGHWVTLARAERLPSTA